METKMYSAPVLEYLDCENEGVLCQSGLGSFNPYDEIEL